MKGLVTAASLVVMLAAITACGGNPTTPAQSAPSTSATASSQSGVSARGQRTEALEALLRHRLGHTSVCTRANKPHVLDFVAGSCSPLADYNPYFFTFGRPHLVLPLTTTTRRPGNLGNYSVPVQLRGKFVTCGDGGYLVKLADAASFTLACPRPL